MTPIRVLMVEDSEDDAALIAREIRRGGYELAFTRVDSEEAMRGALNQKEWDLVCLRLFHASLFWVRCLCAYFVSQALNVLSFLFRAQSAKILPSPP